MPSTTPRPMAPTPNRTAEAVATRLAAALRAAERARACTAARLRLAHWYSMANTASASAITTRPGPGATKSTTPTARITVPTTVTAIRRSSLIGSFTSSKHAQHTARAIAGLRVSATGRLPSASKGRDRGPAAALQPSARSRWQVGNLPAEFLRSGAHADPGRLHEQQAVVVPDRGHVMRDSGLGARGRAGDPRRRLRRDIPGPAAQQVTVQVGQQIDVRMTQGTRWPIREPAGPDVPAAAQLTPGCPGGRYRQPGPGLGDLPGDKTRARGTDDPGLVPRRQRGDPRQLPRPRRHRGPLGSGMIRIRPKLAPGRGCAPVLAASRAA